MKRTTLAAAAILAAAPLTIAAPAHADGAYMYHYMPDDGYDPGIKVACDDGYITEVIEGYSSSAAFTCGNSHGPRLQSIYIRSGEELWCKGASDGVWRRKFDATGWHPVNSDFNDGAGCTLRVD